MELDDQDNPFLDSTNSGDAEEGPVAADLPSLISDSPEGEDALEGGEELAEADLSEPGDERAWYVVHCYSGYENKVRHNLEQRIETMGMKDKIFDVVVPTEEEIEVKEGSGARSSAGSSRAISWLI
jgi:hypothetical protein